MCLNGRSLCLPAPRRPIRRGLGGLALLVLLAGTAPAAEPFTKETFVSGGKKVRVERFEPGPKGKFPAVVLLYGVDGLHGRNAAIFRGGRGRSRTAGSWSCSSTTMTARLPA